MIGEENANRRQNEKGRQNEKVINEKGRQNEEKVLD